MTTTAPVIAGHLRSGMRLVSVAHATGMSFRETDARGLTVTAVVPFNGEQFTADHKRVAVNMVRVETDGATTFNLPTDRRVTVEVR